MVVVLLVTVAVVVVADVAVVVVAVVVVAVAVEVEVDVHAMPHMTWHVVRASSPASLMRLQSDGCSRWPQSSDSSTPSQLCRRYVVVVAVAVVAVVVVVRVPVRVVVVVLVVVVLVVLVLEVLNVVLVEHSNPHRSGQCNRAKSP